jgi:virulence-associated protein VapD
MTSLIDRSPETLKENHFRSHANLNFVQTKETQGNLRVYAIAFDMDIESLRQSYGDPYNNAYTDIRKVLQSHGFSPQQGSVYFGDSTVNAVTCVLAAQDLARKLPWFSSSVRDIRMLRIEEFNDLGPAVQTIG